MDEIALLRRFAETGDQAAFTELVRRHIDFVYTVALRNTGGDAALAEDVAQGVFVALARKANALSQRAAIVGWLYRTAQFTAIDKVRAEARRRRREQEAHAMDQPTTPTQAWEQVRPHLERAIAALPPTDRDAVVMRFFGRQSFAEVGRVLCVSEDAARMKVQRALERVRHVLARNGINSTAAALALGLDAVQVTAAPAHLVTSISGAVAGGCGAALSLVSLGMTKLQTTVLAGIVLGGGFVVAYQQLVHTGLRRDIALLQNEARQAATLRAENDRLRQRQPARSDTSADDMGRLRAEVESLEQAVLARRNQAPDVAANAEEVTRGMVPVSSLSPRGFETPGHAAESIVWAREHFDIATLARNLDVAPETKAEAERLFAGIRPEVRARFPEVTSAESLLAMAWTLASKPIAGLRVTGAYGPTPETETVRGIAVAGDGTTTRIDLNLHQIDGNWRLVIPPGLSRQLLQKAAATAGVP